MALGEGTRLNDTRVVDSVLGVGSHAEVYRVHHRHLGWQAMKVFRAVSSRSEIEELLGDVRLLSRLGHPHLVRVFDAGAVDTDSWLDALDTPDFWAHVRHRARVLGDRRIDESTVAGLAEAMPRALIAPLVELARRSPEPARLAALVHEWELESEVIDDALEAVAEPTYQEGKELVRDLQKLVDDGDAMIAAARALGTIPDAAGTLDAVLPHERFRRSASLRNQMAVVLNNCALAVDPLSRHRDLVPRLLTLAADLVVDEDDRETIRRELARRGRRARLRAALDHRSLRAP